MTPDTVNALKSRKLLEDSTINYVLRNLITFIEQKKANRLTELKLNLPLDHLQHSNLFDYEVNSNTKSGYQTVNKADQIELSKVKQLDLISKALEYIQDAGYIINKDSMVGRVEVIISWNKEV